MLSNDSKLYLCISIHDVAPETWPACSRLLRMLDRLHVGPLTLLVVPDYHHTGSLVADPDFCKAMDQRLKLGDEIALHGFFHVDECEQPRTPGGWFRRRWMTAGEAEFAALPAAVARQRLEAGLAILHSCGWPVHGFIAPAWQLGKPARSVLTDFPFDYTTTRTAIWRLPRWQRLHATSLVYSVRSRIRRRLSWYWNELQSEYQRDVTLLRISLHPADVIYPEVLEHWCRIIGNASRRRETITKHAWVMRQA